MYFFIIVMFVSNFLSSSVVYIHFLKITIYITTGKLVNIVSVQCLNMSLEH